MFDIWSNTKLNLNSRMLGMLVVLILQSCMSEIKPQSSTGGSGVAVSTTGYSGCVVATGTSISTIQVSYDFPAKASEISVYRNGANVLTSRNKLSTSFIDINLSEGQTYKYECVALIDGITTVGTRSVEGTTLAVNPPVFAGIDNVAIISPTSVRINWQASTGGAVAKTFKVFSSMNATLSFTDAPKLNMPSGVYTAVLSGLADDMPYEFAVRACNSNGVCDTNTKTIAITTSDKGPATTVGATSVALYNGLAQITAPWAEVDGAILKRRLYRSTTNDVSTILSNPIKTVNVTLAADLAHPPTKIEDDTITEGQTYYYIVRDEDPSGNTTESHNVVTLSIGDLTAPTFSGLTSVTLDTPTETSVLLNWTAISSQPSDPAGATLYLLYRSEANLPASPVNACAAGTLVQSFSTLGYPAGLPASYKVVGLTSRKKYSFCLKAQDAALNISNTLSFREQLMPDITAPQFDGLQNASYDVALNKFSMIWNPSTSADINQYIVKVWRNTATPTAGQITTIIYNASANPSSAIFGNTEFTFTDGDTVYMLVDACDNASPSYNTSNNCTAFPTSSAIVKNLIDTTPPPGFLGVSSTLALVQGAIQVNWNLPADKSDYAGFKFYNIEETSPGVYAKVFLGDTYCIMNNCASNPKTTHPLAISRDYHTYKIFVSAVDMYGNETRATDAVGTIVGASSQITSLDTTVPNFTSSLASTVSSGSINLSWNAATDNQFSKKNVNTNNVIEYEIYRREGLTNFDTADYVASVPNYTGDPTITRVASGLTTLTFNDPTAPLTQGQTYHYTVCARDESNNVICNGFRSLMLADNLAPVIATVRVDEAPNSSSWNLDIKVNDGVKEPNTVIVYVFAKYSDDPNDFPNDLGAQVSSALMGAGSSGTPAEFVFYTGNIADTGTNHYVNYYVKAVDAASNVSTRTYSHLLRRPSISAHTLSYTLNEDTNTPITLTTTGAPGTGLSAANLSYEVVTPPAHGTLSNCMNMAGAANGLDLSCSYIGTSNYFGTDTFTYRVKDNLPINSTNVVTVNLTITNVNDVPVATNVTKSVMITAGIGSDSALLDVTATASDADNTMVPGTNTLTVTPISPSLANPNFGTVNCAAGQTCTVNYPIYYINKLGTTTFSYQIYDGYSTSAVGTYTLKTYSQWTWTGAIDNDWNKGGNWCGSLNASGNCVGASGPPPGGVYVVFSDLCVNCNPIMPTTVNSLTFSALLMTETFTGKVTMASGAALNVTQYLEIQNGTFDGTAGASITNNASGSGYVFGLYNSAIFKAPTLMTITISDSRYGFFYASSGSTFTHNFGTVVLNQRDAVYGSAGAPVNFAGKNFYNLTINNGLNTTSVIAASQFTVLNNLKVERGSFTQSADNISTKVGGNLIEIYTHGSSYGNLSYLNSTLIGNNSAIVMGLATQNAGKITIDQGANVVATTDLVVSHLYVKDGTFTAPVGKLTISPAGVEATDYGSFNYSGAADDANVTGLVVDTTGTFNHNSGKVIFQDTRSRWNEARFQAGIRSINALVLNDVDVDIADNGDIWTSISYHGNSGVQGALLVTETSNLKIIGTLKQIDGAIKGGSIDLRGNYIAKCANLAGPCSTGGSTEIFLNEPAQTISMETNAIAPVMVLNNGNTITPAGTNIGFTGLRVINGTFSAPPVFRIGPEYGTAHKSSGENADHPGYVDVMFEVDETFGTFVHNNGLLKFTNYGVNGSYTHSGYGLSNKIKVSENITFYDVEIDVWNGYGGRANCIDLLPSTTMKVARHFTNGGQCVRGGIVKVGGDLVFKAGSNNDQDRPNYLTTAIELYGNGTQNISRIGPFNGNMGTLGANLAINKSGGVVNLISDFSGDDAFNQVVIQPGNTLNLNGNSLPNSPSIVWLNSGTVNP